MNEDDGVSDLGAAHPKLTQREVVVDEPDSMDAADILVAAIVAARKSGDFRLERAARMRLWTRHGIALRFAQDPPIPETVLTA